MLEVVKFWVSLGLQCDILLCLWSVLVLWLLQR